MPEQALIDAIAAAIASALAEHGISRGQPDAASGPGGHLCGLRRQRSRHPTEVDPRREAPANPPTPATGTTQAQTATQSHRVWPG